MADDLESRKGLSFAQAEGVEPLPRQLDRKELSPRLRSMMWECLHTHVYYGGGGYIAHDWYSILRYYQVYHLNLPVDEFNGTKTLSSIKNDLMTGDYIEFYGVIQFLLGLPSTPSYFESAVINVLDEGLSAFRVVEKTLVPIATNQEAEAVRGALDASRESGQTGAHAHLQAAIRALGSRSYADSVTESIAAVEAVARTLTGKPAKFSDALSLLERGGTIHGSLKKAFSALYGYASDEEGLRHSLLERGAANVDEADAIMMLGACSSFVSYILAKKAKQEQASRL